MNINRRFFRGYSTSIIITVNLKTVKISQSIFIITSKPALTMHHARSASTFNRFRSWYRSIFRHKAIKPPFLHVCQVGDPVLRQAAERVPPEQISSEEVQKVIASLQIVMKKYDVVSLSAPQIGVPLQIFVMELSKEVYEKFPEHMRNIFKISIIPPKVVINPAVKVLDYTTETYWESCPSIFGFSADVSRYSSLKISAWDENAEKNEWEASGHESRVIQHEMDHLAGLLFIDRMEARSLTCSAWEAVNEHQGQVFIPFWPKKKRLGIFGNSPLKKKR